MANITGWGRGAWGEGAWNAPIPVVVSGIEQVTNGEFDSDTTGWSTTSNSSASVSGGIVTITANQFHTFSQNLTLDAGRSYTISVLVTDKSGNFYVAIHDGSSVTDFKNVTVGTTTLTFTANSGTNNLRLYPYSSGTGHTLSVDSISVKGAVETEGTTTLGSVTVAAGATVVETGLAGTSALGNTVETGTAKVIPTGVAGTSALGNEVSFTNVVVIETGLQGTTALGNVVSDGGAVGAPSGVAGTSALGNTTETGTGSFSVTGNAGTTAVGTAQAFPEFVVGATGVAGTGAVGNGSVSGTCAFSVTGVAGTSALGEEGTSAGSLVIETGLSATGAVGTVTILPSLAVPVTGSAGTGNIGDALGAGGAQVVEEGLTGTVNIGDEAVSGGATVSVTGVSATGGLRTDDTGTVTFAVEVRRVSGANYYFIDGVQQATLSLTEGKTYRFDQSSSAYQGNSGHPLRFSTTSNGTHGGGTEYTTGVTTSGTPGSAGAYTEITVAVGAPTLYYYCTNHSGMGGQINTIASSDLVITGGATFATTGVAGTSALGTAIGVIPIIVSVTGFSVTTSLGTATSSVVSNIVITGVEGTGTLGTLNLYGIIANDISVSYTEVTPSQTPNWVESAA